MHENELCLRIQIVVGLEKIKKNKNAKWNETQAKYYKNEFIRRWSFDVGFFFSMAFLRRIINIIIFETFMKKEKKNIFANNE